VVEQPHSPAIHQKQQSNAAHARNITTREQFLAIANNNIQQYQQNFTQNQPKTEENRIFSYSN